MYALALLCEYFLELSDFLYTNPYAQLESSVYVPLAQQWTQHLGGINGVLFRMLG